MAAGCVTVLPLRQTEVLLSVCLLLVLRRARDLSLLADAQPCRRTAFLTAKASLTEQ